MQTIAKTQALNAIARLPDTFTLAEMLAALERLAQKTATPPHPVDRCFGALGKGRRTETIMAELRDRP
jgi:hypothetical protein